APRLRSGKLLSSLQETSYPRAGLLSLEQRRTVYRFERQAISASDLITRLAGQFQIADLTVEEPETEDMVRRIYEEQLLTSAVPEPVAT
ncbi:MAG: hypothetical protein R3264_14130, partial [Anaerolineae bacterium]|nr:hypothetical protein [Anaerolineae bacterium]